MTKSTIKEFLIFMFLYVCLLSCNMKTYKLLDGISRVPTEQSVYKNKIKFDTTLLAIIDTNAIYEEYDQELRILKRLNIHMGRGTYGVLRFYPNGCLNEFGLDRDKRLAKGDLNPLYHGYRGVYYNENSKIRFDLFAEVDQRQHIGLLKGTIYFNGDTMYFKRDDLSYKEIYIKRKVLQENLNYTADW